MKKLLTISILTAIIILSAVTGVNATTGATLADELYAKLSKYGMTSADKVKVNRYVADNKVTEDQANSVMAKANEAVKVMENAGVTNYAKLTDAQKEEVKSIAKEAAKIVDVTLVFGKEEVKIYKNGKLIDVVGEKDGKLVYTGSKDLADALYNMLSKYGMTNADKVKVERYVADYKVTDAQAEKVVAQAEKAVAIMDKAGKTNYTELSNSDKAELKSIANEAANILDVTLTFDGSKVKVYKNGKLLDVIRQENGKLVYTGNNNIVLVVSSIAVIALATVAVARKKLANA